MRSIFKLFAEKYAWTAQQVGKLTPAQITMYLGGAGSGSQYPMPYSEWKMRRAGRKQ